MLLVVKVLKYTCAFKSSCKNMMCTGNNFSFKTYHFKLIF